MPRGPAAADNFDVQTRHVVDVNLAAFQQADCPQCHAGVEEMEEALDLNQVAAEVDRQTSTVLRTASFWAAV